MASYNSNQLEGAGAPIEALTSGSTYTFALTSSISGSTYFTLETVRNPIGYYDSSSPATATGIIENLTNITGLVASPYIFSVIVNQGGGSFTFTPAANVTVSGSFLRGTGGISLNVNTSSSLITPYSLFFESTTTFAQLDPGIIIGGTYQQPFTVEGWFKSSNPGVGFGPVLLSTSTGSSTSAYIRALTINCTSTTAPQIVVDSNGAAANTFSFASLPNWEADAWYYVAVSRDASGIIQAWLGKEGDEVATASTSGRFDCSVNTTAWALTGISDTIGRFVPANRDSDNAYISDVRITTTNLYTTTDATIPIPTETFNYVAGIEFLLGPTSSVDLTGNNVITLNTDTSFVDIGPNINVVNYNAPTYNILTEDSNPLITQDNNNIVWQI
jgi:hypothetical protein